jgi:MFS family permease
VVERPPRHHAAQPARSLGKLVGVSTFRVLYGSIFLMSLALFVPFVFLTSYAEDMGISSGMAAALIGFIGGASIMGRLALGAIAPRVGLIRLYQSCFAVMGLAFVIWLAAGDRVELLILFTVVLGVAYGGFIALSPAVAAQEFGLAGLGGVLGALYTSAGVGGLIGPPLAGVLIDVTDSYTAAIRVATVLTFAAFAVLLRLRVQPAVSSGLAS